ncbi:MAG: hypothetical protein CUR34_12575 [Sediminibacterium sp.]|nr:MAG: hypothetical protein CUR34_12575 [Sediminibacterium sp.] [Sediminibacterium sp. FEMGT703S]
MSENQQEQNLEDVQQHSSTEIHNSFETSSETIEQAQPMEVHHHAHHDHGKKTLKSYFWEFFMLFLAVFCGFLAENFREHYIEEQRVERQLNIMVDNLDYDITRIDNNQKITQYGIAILDSLRYEVVALINGKKDYNRFYKLREGLSAYGEPRFNSSAYDQLTTTGLLRLIKSDSLILHINDYYERVTYMVDAAVNFTNIINEKTTGLYNEISDQTPFNDVITDFKVQTAGKKDTAFEAKANAVFESKQLVLIKSDKATLHKIYNYLVQFEVAMKTLDARMDYAKKAADDLKNHIKSVNN